MAGDDDALAAAIGEALRTRGAMVAVAETTAGGLLSARLVAVPGASAWFERGCVAYSAAAKRAIGVPEAILASAGAVSASTAAALAEAIRATAGVAFGLAETGIAGPQTGRRSAKQPGTAFVALAGPEGTIGRELFVPGSRREVMEGLAQAALELLAEALGVTPAAQGEGARTPPAG